MTFVTWKWQAPGSARQFAAKHVNVLYQMVARNYARPFRFVCITDDTGGLDPRVEAMPMPARFDHIQSPSGPRFPNCYCRLWNFSREARILGERILQLDIDCVVTADLAPLLDRAEDFVGWSGERFQAGKIAGGAYLLRTGSLPRVWDDFDPLNSPAEAHAAGNFGSDQGWMSYKIRQDGHGEQIGFWNDDVSLVKINWTAPGARAAPSGARIVFTSGMTPPWSKDTRAKYPWVREYWRNPCDY